MRKILIAAAIVLMGTLPLSSSAEARGGYRGGYHGGGYRGVYHGGYAPRRYYGGYRYYGYRGYGYRRYGYYGRPYYYGVNGGALAAGAALGLFGAALVGAAGGY